MLWASAVEKGYGCPIWMTYKQAGELGGQVKKGERGSLVVFANRITREVTDDKGDTVETRDPFHERIHGFLMSNRSTVCPAITTRLHRRSIAMSPGSMP